MTPTNLFTWGVHLTVVWEILQVETYGIMWITN